MTTKRFYWVLLIALVTYSNSSNAGYFRTGNQINQGLQSWEAGAGNDVGGTLAAGYVMGVFDSSDGWLFCSPAGVTVGQTTAVVEKYMTAHPEHLEQPAVGIVLDALRGAWPCPKSAPKHKVRRPTRAPKAGEENPF